MKSYIIYWLFSFHSDNWNKLAISLQKLAIFNIYHVSAPFVKLRGSRLLYFFSLCDVMKEAVIRFLKHSSLRGVKQKKYEKKYEILAFKLLIQEIRLKNLTSKTIFWSSNNLNLEIKKKKKSYRSLQKWSEIELYSHPYGFIKNLRQIHLKDSFVKFTGKIKVSNTTWAKLRGLIDQKRQSSFQ